MEILPSSAAKAGGKAFVMAGWHVEPSTLRISNDGKTVKLEPKAMAVLDYLACRPGAVVTRQELERSLWAGTVVGYDALSNTIIKLRKAFGDKARAPAIIETIPKTGYRLIAEVEPLPADNLLSSAVGTAGNERLPRKPSIAILPFDNMSGDAEQEYFSDGLSEDITTDLSKLSGLLVIARNSAFAYKGKPVDLSRISRELGVRYALEGSVRKSGSRIRINAQLIDCTTGGHIWAERYDRDLHDIFSVQDEVTREIVTAIAPSLTGSDQDRLEQRETGNFEAYDLFLKGREQLFLDNEQSIAEARRMLQRAIDIDPRFSSAHAYLSRCQALEFINSWGDPATRSMASALELGRRAIELNPDNPRAHFAAGTAALWLGMHDLAQAEIRQAIEIDPNFADGYGALGMIQVYSGEPEQALESIDTVMRLDPHYRDIYLHLTGQACFHMRRYDEAVEALQRRLVRKPESDISRVLLAACFGHLGEADKGRNEWREALRSNPNYSIARKREILPYRNPGDFDEIVDGLRLAGIEVDE